MKNDKTTKKGSRVVFLRVKGPLREWLEEEQAERTGGAVDQDDIKLQPIVTEKLLKQMASEKKKK